MSFSTPMIRVQNLSLAFYEQILFDELSCAFQPRDRVGLVGRNGSGKSTFLQILANGLSPDSGVIEKAHGFTIAYMPQDVVCHSSKTVYEEAFTAFAAIVQAQEEADRLEKLFDDQTAEVTEELLTRYSDLKEKLVEWDVSAAQAKTLAVLKGLGFKQEQLEQSVQELSVGWKMRLVLAHLLLQDADFYLFDEPTNHLDIFAKEWFLGFLKESKKGFLLVCHERYFLDKLCETVLELEQGKGTVYTGNYSAYQMQKEARQESLASAYARQQKEIERKKATIERFRASATKAKMAQSMIKSLDKIELIEKAEENRTIRFSFKEIKQSGREVLKVEKLAQQFGEKKIFERVTFSVERGEKIALVAANGVGKTTLFNTLIERHKQQAGTISFGYNVDYAVFDQDQTAVLDKNKTILQEVEDAVPHQTTQAIRTILGAFLFGAQEITKKTGVLSGGEKNRLSIAKVLLSNANFLLLDEPTNHLDIQSKDILLQALRDYKGTLLFVSHDYEFVNQLATRVLELTPTGVHSYPGNYDSYLEQKRAQEAVKNGTPEKVVVQEKHVKKESSNQPQKVGLSNKELYEWRKALSRLEAKIEKLTAQSIDLRTQFEGASYGTDEYTKLSAQLAEIEKKYTAACTDYELLKKN